jgi:hypothetical protein
MYNIPVEDSPTQETLRNKPKCVMNDRYVFNTSLIEVSDENLLDIM